jgi:hypothetical protein
VRREEMEGKVLRKVARMERSFRITSRGGSRWNRG